jgi:hypothetical protein
LDADEEIRFHDQDYYEWLPDGQYSARCVEVSGPVRFKGTRKLFLHFSILTEPWCDKTIFGAFDVGFNAVKPGRRYFRAWCVANEGRLPSRNAIMSPRVFKGKTFMVTTRTVHQDMDQAFWYSVIDTVDQLEAPDNKADLVE